MFNSETKWSGNRHAKGNQAYTYARTNQIVSKGKEADKCKGGRERFGEIK